MSKHEMLQIIPIKETMSQTNKRWRIFGDYIRTNRENAHLSQDGLGKLIGKDRQTIYRIENALSGTKRDTVVNLADALKLDQADALIKAGFAPQDEKKLQLSSGVAISGFDGKDFSEDEKEKILSYVNFIISQRKDN